MNGGSEVVYINIDVTRVIYIPSLSLHNIGQEGDIIGARQNNKKMKKYGSPRIYRPRPFQVMYQCSAPCCL